MVAAAGGQTWGCEDAEAASPTLQNKAGEKLEVTTDGVWDRHSSQERQRRACTTESFLF